MASVYTLDSKLRAKAANKLSADIREAIYNLGKFDKKASSTIMIVFGKGDFTIQENGSAILSINRVLIGLQEAIYKALLDDYGTAEVNAFIDKVDATYEEIQNLLNN